MREGPKPLNKDKVATLKNKSYDDSSYVWKKEKDSIGVGHFQIETWRGKPVIFY